MQNLLLAAAAAALAVPLAAQPDHFTTSPEGYDFKEGNGVSNDLLGSTALLRYQQIDSTNTRSMTNRNRIAFRRDGWTPDNPAYGPRNIDLEVVLSESDLKSISTAFANNYKTNTATAFSRKVVAFQDWTLMPPAPAAPESNIIFLDAPWSYAGKTATGNDLLWEVRVYGNDQAGQPYPYDFELVDPNASFGTVIPTRSTATNLNTGCTLTGKTSAFSLSNTILNDRTNFTWSSSTSNGIAGNPVVMLLDGVNRNLPGLCTSLHALAVNFVHGTSSGTGSTSLTLVFPHSSAAVGQSLYMQAATSDAGKTLGIGLTRAQKVDISADPNDPVIGRVWSYNPNASTATVGPLPGGVILWNNHP